MHKPKCPPNDGNLCQPIMCVEGYCVYGNACDDGNPCTTDSRITIDDDQFNCESVNRSGSCPDDGKPCTYHMCQNGACSHPVRANGTACPDEPNACTYDICENRSCVHPLKPDCVVCDQHWCIQGSCVPETCMISVMGGQACPEGSADVTVSGMCAPMCNNSVSWTITSPSS